MSFFILYTNEVGEKQHAIERYIAHYQYHFTAIRFPLTPQNTKRG